MQADTLAFLWPANATGYLQRKHRHWLVVHLFVFSMRLMICRFKCFMAASMQSWWRPHETDVVKSYSWFHVWAISLKTLTAQIWQCVLRSVCCRLLPWLVVCPWPYFALDLIPLFLIFVIFTSVVCPWPWFALLVTGWRQQWWDAREGHQHGDRTGSDWGRGSFGKSAWCLVGGEHSVSTELFSVWVLPRLLIYLRP